MDELQPGTILGGRYCVERLIAQGGMSRLYQGHPLEGAGRVAIKQLDVPEQGPVQCEDLEQFQKEYDVLHDLDHPGLARALDFFEEAGRHYLVEEFVPGETLEAHIQAAGQVPPEQAVRIMAQLLRVLEYLHGYCVIYRDLKPQNVILQPRPSEDGEETPGSVFPYTVRLVDFGAARRWKAWAVADTIALGTPGYAPPEQYGQAQSDGRSDIYGAGALLHYMLTGHPPDPTRGWVFEAPHDLVPGIPRELGLAVLQAVQADPAQRFQEAGEMRQSLLQAVGAIQFCPACARELPDDGRACVRCSTRHGIPLWGQVLVVLVSFGFLAMLVTPWALRVRARELLTGCQSNLKNLGTALEMYSTDNGGRFVFIPLRAAFVPKYLKAIPTCPAVGSDTYSTGFSAGSGPDAYTIVCSGKNHSEAGQGEHYPQYTSTQGLISQ